MNRMNRINRSSAPGRQRDVGLIFFDKASSSALTAANPARFCAFRRACCWRRWPGSGAEHALPGLAF
jgi:hypothetical protein